MIASVSTLARSKVMNLPGWVTNGSMADLLKSGCARGAAWGMGLRAPASEAGRDPLCPKLYALRRPQGANVDEVPRHRGRGGHFGADQVRAPPLALAAFKVAVAGAGAALLGLEFVRVHRQAHAAAGLAPLRSGFGEDAVQP